MKIIIINLVISTLLMTISTVLAKKESIQPFNITENGQSIEIMFIINKYNFVCLELIKKNMEKIYSM